MEDSGNRVMYYLSDGPERAFVVCLFPKTQRFLRITFRNGNIYPTGISIIANDMHELS